ncbi:hypothetical protein PAULFLAKE_69 [Enterococcus phage vB_EfaS_Paulomi]|nr:hypothetical protein PAULFLAKE_69 [Enterococcus phage vB_EfaS_Paulomi]
MQVVRGVSDFKNGREYQNKTGGIAKFFRPPLDFLVKLIGDAFCSHEFLKTKLENTFFPL